MNMVQPDPLRDRAAIAGVPNDQVKVGDAVEVVFDPVTDQVTIPRFRLRDAR